MTGAGMISVTAATGLLDAVAAAGGSADQVLHAAGVERASLRRPDGFIRSSAFGRLLEESAQATGDPCFGLQFGARFDPRDIGVLAYVVVNSPTVAAAMRNVERYLHIHNSEPRVSFGIEGGRGCLRYTLADPAQAGMRQHNEYSMAVLVNTFRFAAGERWMPAEIEFAHAPSADCDYPAVFGCPVRFACAMNALIVADEVLGREVAAADPKLYRALRVPLDSAIPAAPRDDDVLEVVRRAIGETLEAGDPRLPRVAAKLAVSSRTLERRLNAHGVAYRDLLGETRRRLALEYLKDSGRTVTEIAFLLGYSEVSAFNRAFKRWTGSTPLAFRASPGVTRPLGDNAAPRA